MNIIEDAIRQAVAVAAAAQIPRREARVAMKLLFADQALRRGVPEDFIIETLGGDDFAVVTARRLVMEGAPALVVEQIGQEHFDRIITALTRDVN